MASLLRTQLPFNYSIGTQAETFYSFGVQRNE